MKDNIYVRKIEKRNKHLCKILSIILVVLMLLSSASFLIASGLSVSSQRIGMTYYYTVGNHDGRPDYSWSSIRQNCFINCQMLVSTYNYLIDSVEEQNNIARIFAYLESHGGDSEKLANYANTWNTFFSHICSCQSDTELLCSNISAVPVVNGKEVTVDQYQNLYSKITEEYDRLLSFVNDIRSYYDAAKAGEGVGMSVVIRDSATIINRMWKNLRLVITEVGFGSGVTNSFLGISTSTDSIQEIADAVSSVTKTFAYALAVILFGVNITTTALQNEILTLRGGIKVFGRVILVKFWIDLAIPICIFALNIVNSLAAQILNILTSSASNVFGTTRISQSSVSSWPAIVALVQKIIRFLAELVTGFPSMIIIIVMGVCIVLVIIKLVARCFELTCLVSISPVFFATLVGEETKRYFRKFMSAFLSTAAYIAYVAIVYAVATKWIMDTNNPNINDSLKSLVLPITSMLPRAIIIVACCRVMVKPPKVLLSLADGG